jgi:F-type H+-transporting ATPase subunit b
MLRAVVTQSGGHVTGVQLVGANVSVLPAAEGEATAAEGTGPNPIAPETKELAWGAGSFLVLLIVMRVFLFPRLKKAMDQRYANIRADIEGADAVKAAARNDVAEYEKALAVVRAEAAAKLDVARAKLDAERAEKLREVNSRIATRRSEAETRAEAARNAARGQISAAVSTVATTATTIAVGKSPDASVVQRAVDSVMEGASR